MIDQIGLTLFSVTAVALTQSKLARRRRWAPLFGLASQPFWFHATFVAEQWGIFALCFVYATIWMKGAVNSWA